ncbi:MAG: DUF373 family protein [Desulfurococcales archaeon]|nr:DUF373 family protein [Desulfurococcales archaeon]
MDKNGKRKPLILVIDIDDDIGEILGKKVIIGYDNVKEAVIEYGGKRPEDADVNAMLAGLKLYRELEERGYNPEIAVLGGHRVDSLEAQRNIKQEVARLVNSINEPVEFYIVSDGEDEFIISQLLHEYGSIAGFYRVIVEQHLGIEGGYLLILRYLKKAVEDPRYSRYLVGIPGIGLLVIGLTALFNVAYLALELLVLVVGFAMIIRGFNLEKPLEDRISGLLQAIWERPYFYAVGLLMFLLFLLTSLYTMYQAVEKYGYTIKATIEISKTSIPILSAGVISYLLISRVFTKASLGNLNLFHEAAGMVVTVAIALAFYNMGLYMENVPSNEEIALHSFVDSGFIQYVIIGTGVAALIELVRRVVYRE